MDNLSMAILLGTVISGTVGWFWFAMKQAYSPNQKMNWEKIE